MARPAEMKAFYEGWEAQHQRIIETLRPLTPEQVQLRPSPEEWAIWMLASNMCGGRLYWLCFMLGEDNLGIGPEWTGWEDTPERPRSRRARRGVREDRGSHSGLPGPLEPGGTQR